MAQKKGKFRGKVLYKYIFAYFSLLFIAVLLGFVLIHDASTHIENEYFAQEKNHAGIIAAQLDTLLDRLDSMNYLLTDSAARKTCMMDSSAFYEMQLVATLSEYQSIGGGDVLTFLCWSDRDRVYDLAGTYTSQVFWMHRLSLKEQPSLEGIWQLGGYPSLVSCQDSGGNTCLLYIYPLSSNSIARYDKTALIVHFFSPSMLAKLLQTLLGHDHYEDFALFFGESPVWFSNPAQQALLTEIWENEPEAGQFFKCMGGHALLNPLKHYDIEMLYYVEDSVWQSTLRNYQNRIIGIMVPFIVVGVLMVIGYIRTSYRPVRKVMAMLPQDAPEGYDEFGYISSGIKKIQQKDERIAARLEEQREMLRHHCLIHLLNGGAVEETEKQEAGIELDSAAYAVLCLRMVGGDILENIEVQQNLETHAGRSRGQYLVDIEEEHALFLLTTSLEKAEVIAGEILSKKWGDGLVIGIGVQDERRAGGGYLQSIIACTEALRRNQDILIFSASDYSYTSSDRENQILIYLDQSIQTGNEAMALEYLKQLVENMKAMHFVDQKCTRFMLINLLRQQYAINARIPAQPMLQAIQTEELETYEENICVIISDICSQVKKNNEEKTKQHNQAIIDYINTHFKEYDISVEKLYHQFSMSGNRLSRLVKEQTGYTPREYIIQKRMNYASKLLKETDMSIGDISNEVGYVSVSHFIRMFREQFGITPNQMRGKE